MTNGWLQLAEHETLDIPEFPLGAGEELWNRYARTGAGLDIEFPSPRTGGAWRITSRGVVGAFPLRDGGGVRVVPKVPIANLLRMIEVAQDVSVRELAGQVSVASVDDLFDRLIAALATGVRRRLRRGLLKAYVSRDDRLPYLRGRLDVRRHVRSGAHTVFDVSFQEPSVDHHDNQVLLATLARVVRSPLLRSETRASVRKALRALSTDVSLVPVAAQDAVRGPYHRLRRDYLRLHRLCRFLLGHSGPMVQEGTYVTTPFLVDMPSLFETCVARGLEEALPRGLRVARHVRERLDPAGRVVFDVDLVLQEAWSGRPLIVLDTKYKDHDAPSAADVQQVVAYAAALGCEEAALVYPTEHTFAPARAGEIVVRRLGVPLDGDVGVAFRELAATLVMYAGAEHVDIRAEDGTRRYGVGHAST
ncbi:MAG: hypothetical protein U5K81_13885 [Trueperaceae bacterium]|nr:hypothetical protein [Trueperaceae bacterium]